MRRIKFEGHTYVSQPSTAILLETNGVKMLVLVYIFTDLHLLHQISSCSQNQKMPVVLPVHEKKVPAFVFFFFFISFLSATSPSASEEKYRSFKGS